MIANKGITLVALIITIVVLLILAGVATFFGIEAIESTKYTKFKSELKIMQTYINSWYEECRPTNAIDNNDYITNFKANIASKFTVLEVSASIATSDTQAQTTLNAIGITTQEAQANYYLLQKDQKEALGIDIDGVTQDVLVSVLDRKVVSYLGMKYRDRMYYTLDDLGEYYNVDYAPPTSESPIIEVTGYRQDNQKIAKINVKTTYNSQYVNKGTVYYGIITDNSNRASNYNSTNNDNFIIKENGKYDIYVVDALGNSSNHIVKYFSKDANSPKLTDGMIPIKWVEGSGNTPSNWVVCDKNDIDWFSYDHKLWANIMLSDGTYKADTVQVGQVVAEADLGSMYVWIPRYAYKMPENSQTTKGTIDVTFLNRNTNKTYEGKVFQKETDGVNTSETPIVHPAFTFGDKELEGIWVAKFEASGTKIKDGATVVVGNRSANSSSYENADPATTIVKSLPNKISWRDITIGNMQYYSMAIADSKKVQYGITSADVNSHLIKNSEWGAVAYLCYSKYGEVPMKNACGVSKNGYNYDLYTGQGPSSTTSDSGSYNYNSTTVTDHKYNEEKGVLASTTRNVTGIYDMNGGAWEYVAAYYDNKNYYLNSCGKSTTAVAGSEVKYIEGAKVKNEYVDYWEAYEVSDSIKVYEGTANEETITTATLASVDNIQDKHTLARYLLTKEIFENLPIGIGMSEISNKFSFYNTYNNGTSNRWNCYENTGTEENPNFTSGNTSSIWDNDNVSLGNASYPFVLHGGLYGHGSGGGVFCSDVYLGLGSYNDGFRSTLVL